MVRCWLGSLSSWSAVTSWEKRAVHQVAPLWLLVGNSCWLPEWCKKSGRKVVVPAEGVTQITSVSFLFPCQSCDILVMMLSSDLFYISIFFFIAFLSSVSQDSLMFWSLPKGILAWTDFLYLFCGVESEKGWFLSTALVTWPQTIYSWTQDWTSALQNDVSVIF